MELQCDASQHGLGAVLLQDEKPIANASRSLTETEQRYAQTEKEMLSIVFACSQFHCYILRSTVTVHNGHKQLEQIFKKNKKQTNKQKTKNTALCTHETTQNVAEPSIARSECCTQNRKAHETS